MSAELTLLGTSTPPTVSSNTPENVEEMGRRYVYQTKLESPGTGSPSCVFRRTSMSYSTTWLQLLQEPSPLWASH